jgi:hypothetical protein
MTPPGSLFRKEAVEAWARAQDPGDGEVRLGARWLTWSYRLLLLLVVVTVVALFVVRTDERVTGSAVVDPRTGSVTALLPARAAPDLSGSRGLTVDLPGGGEDLTGVDVDHAEAADEPTIRRAGLEPLSQPAILLTGHLRNRADLPSSSTETVRAPAVVVLRSERLVDMLARQFRAMLGDRAAQA